MIASLYASERLIDLPFECVHVWVYGESVMGMSRARILQRGARLIYMRVRGRRAKSKSFLSE